MGERSDSSKEFAVRAARFSDVARIVEMVNGAYRGASGRRGWTTEADLIGGQRVDENAVTDLISRENSVVLLACTRTTGEITACVHLELQSNESQSLILSYLGMLTVDVTVQTKGVGNFLLSEAESYARNVWHVSKMEMTVISVRRELIEWYQKRGYEISGERRPFPYGNPRFGEPFRDDLEFEVLVKPLTGDLDDPSASSQTAR